MLIKLHRTFLLVLVLGSCCFPYSLLAKNALALAETDAQDSVKPRKALKKARMYIKMGQYHNAAKYYEIYFKADSGNHHINYELAETYYMLGRFEEAAYLFDKVNQQSLAPGLAIKAYSRFLGYPVYRKKKSGYLKASYYAGMSYKYMGNCEMAKYRFAWFINTYKEEDAEYYLARAKLETEGCNMLLALNKFQGKRIKRKITLSRSNYNRIPYAPVILDDSTVMFNMVGFNVHYNNLFRETYITTATPRKGIWYEYKPYSYLDGPVFDRHTFVLNGSFSPDKKKYYFTKCKIAINYRKPPNSLHRTYLKDCGIYYCELKNNKWGKHIRLPDHINQKNTNNGMPNIGTDSAGNEVLYFVSDRPGGYGGADIWVSIYDKRKKWFGLPENAGANINTRFSEITPFYHTDSATLYFSTDGRPSLGGLDVYFAKGSTIHWHEPKNLGIPLNTPEDDDYFIVNVKHTQGFMRTGYYPTEGGCFPQGNTKKLYHIQLDAPTLTVLVNVYDKQNGNFISGSKVENLFEEQHDVFTPLQTLQTESRNSLNFAVQFAREYKVRATKLGYYEADTVISTYNYNTTDTLFINLYLKPIPEPPIVIHHIYFGFDNAVLTEKSKKVLDSALLIYMYLNPTAVIEIGAHTDNLGNADYNLKLSQRRAESVVDHLIKKGVSAKRLVPKGYGSTQPLVTEKNEDGSDNPERRQTNRRVEFRVLSR